MRLQAKLARNPFLPVQLLKSIRTITEIEKGPCHGETDRYIVYNEAYQKKSISIREHNTERKNQGYSNSDIERPAGMICWSKIEAGKVKTVVVNYMSRLGRDYL
ncbi:hypothetical protein D3C81_338620 [compost metagenome]